MLKLKDIKIVESKKELEALPEGKLLINTINACIFRRIPVQHFR
jgi:N-acetylglucosaminyldiphosphoundecaprenol N-acetyl-beta-D-mannosaminyltransferase